MKQGRNKVNEISL